ncbi:hypothetical protein PENSPDRAFT_654705 [Peniophora sp. CONT]|nr:hypothetical protein PENSPDRAFT_654705 [Peniophora sp. CONT]
MDVQDRTSRLPVELLEQVFLWTYALHNPDYGMAGMPACAFLSHVSRRWREVAVRCQALWSEAVRPSIAATELCLTRCPTHPVKLAVDARFTQLDGDSERYRQAVRLAFGAAKRAEVITVRLNADGVLLGFAEALTFEKHLSELKDLLYDINPCPSREIVIEYESDSGDTFSVDEIIEHTSRKLSIIRLTGCQATYLKAFSSTNIRELRLCNSILWNSVDDMVTLFRALPLLEVLDYSYDHDRHASMAYPKEYSEPLPEVRMDHLKRLDLRSFWREDVTIYTILSRSPQMNASIASRATHESLMSTTTLTFGEYLMTCILRFSHGMIMLMQASRIHQREPVFQDEVLLSISFHDDNFGIDVQSRLSARPYNQDTQSVPVDAQSFSFSASLPSDMKAKGDPNHQFDALVRGVTGAPHRPHLLDFNGNLAGIDRDILIKLSQCTVILVLGQLCDVKALVAALPALPPPSFDQLVSIEVTADISEPQSTLRELADALQGAYLVADDPLLWERLTLYWHPRPEEVFVLNSVTQTIERAKAPPPGLGLACNPIF